MPNLNQAEMLLKNNFIGPNQLKPFFDSLNLEVTFNKIPEIPYSLEKLESLKSEYILILGIPETDDKTPIDILVMRSKFGLNPDLSEPCFYNQDWYLNEQFIQETLDLKWYLLRKEVFLFSKAQNPDIFLDENNDIKFPSAILCTFCFFTYFFSTNELLWKHDFIWCSDIDNNRDRIYIGKYNDETGISKNGFSIHRHLTIREHYGCINTLTFEQKTV